MELRQYVQILFSRWWLILPATFIGLTGALLFSYTQDPIYQANSTYVTSLDTQITEDRDATIYALETLTGRQRIFVTYCEIMISKSVREASFRALNVDPTTELAEKYKIECTNLPETNVLLLTVEGPAPTLVQNLNDAVGVNGSVQANSLYQFFPLQRLDPPLLEEDPVAPQTVLNGVLGGAFGLVLGISAALLLEYLKRPSDQLAGLSIRNQQLGIFNENYFRRRFLEELERASVRMRPISLAVIRLQADDDFYRFPEEDRVTLVRRTALKLEEKLAQGNMIAYLRSMTFGVLLVETPSEDAMREVNALQALIRESSFTTESGYRSNFVSNAGVVSSSGDLKSYNEMTKAAFEALQDAQEKGNTLRLIRATPGPFHDTDVQDFDLSEPALDEMERYGGGGSYNVPAIEDDETSSISVADLEDVDSGELDMGDIDTNEPKRGFLRKRRSPNVFTDDEE